MSNRKQTWKAAVSAAAIAASAMTSFAATNITSNVTLTEDTDWTEFGTVTLAGNATIDLAGHDLKVGGLDGAGTITTSGNILNNGSLESQPTIREQWRVFINQRPSRFMDLHR